MQAVIDRFEGNKAVLLVGEDEIPVVFPRKYLPEDIAEGDYIKFEIFYDEEATKQANEEAKALQQLAMEQNR
ncbi:MAG: hypothetical protein H6Q70_4181 [Firmicutes bacterium]|jgi:hypothetical protein|nr:hypothetical protein [Bacillota bacterium]